MPINTGYIMPINTGYIEGTANDGDLVVRVYYDATQPAGPDQPLIDGPRGYCLDMTNLSGRRYQLTITPETGTPINLSVAQGDPVISGPASGRSRTAAQMAALGYTTRGSVGSFQIG